MIRYFYSLGFLAFCSGYPLLAMDSPHPLPSTSSLSESKAKKEKEKLSASRMSAAAHHDKDKVSADKTKKDAKPDAKVASAKPSSSATISDKKVKEASAKSPTEDRKHEGFITSARKSSTAPTAFPPPTRGASLAQSHNGGPFRAKPGEHLARLTAYWAGEGDYYTEKCISSTGIHLHDGHCAVDPNVIPYGSVVQISGLGSYIAVDTGSAVISREAARETGHTQEERNALVIDLFFEKSSDGRRFAASGPKYASITWHAPGTADDEPKPSREFVADENGKPHAKPL